MSDDKDSGISTVLISGNQEDVIDFIDVLGRTREFMQAAYKFADSGRELAGWVKRTKVLDPDNPKDVEMLGKLFNSCVTILKCLPEIWESASLMRHDMTVLESIAPALSELPDDSGISTNPQQEEKSKNE